MNLILVLYETSKEKGRANKINLENKDSSKPQYFKVEATETKLSRKQK